MSSKTEEGFGLNLNSTFITSDKSIDFHPNNYNGYFYWTAYFHYLNQQSMMSLPTHVKPLDSTEKRLNLAHSSIKQSNCSPTSSSSSSSTPTSSSANMKDLCRYNPTNLSKKQKDLQSDNASLKGKPNCDEWNSKDKVNNFLDSNTFLNQCNVSEDLDGDCSQKMALYDHDYNGQNKKMANKKEIPSNAEMSKEKKITASHPIYPINQPQFLNRFPTNEYAVVNESQMDEIIAKELDLALSLTNKGCRHYSCYKLGQQERQKTRSKTRRRSSKDRLISCTVERIKAAVFNGNPNPYSFNEDKISNHEANQQDKKMQSLPQLEPSNQYLANATPIPIQFMFHPEVMCQSANTLLIHSAPKQYCACKDLNSQMNNEIPTSSASTLSHSNIKLPGPAPSDHSIHSILNR